MKSSNLTLLTTDQLIDLFEKIALLQDEALIDDDHKQYNKLYGMMDTVDNELKQRGQEARRALLRLFAHSNIQVRLKAATRTLAVAPAEAREILESIAASAHYPYAGHAGMLIAGLDDGTFKPN
jgi:hypothetical protein